MDALSVKSAWPSALRKGHWNWYVVLRAFAKKPVVTGVCTKPGLSFEVVPPIDLDLSEFTLKVYAMEGSFFLRTIRLS